MKIKLQNTFSDGSYWFPHSHSLAYHCTWRLIESSLLPIQIKSAKFANDFHPHFQFLATAPRLKVKYKNWPAYAYLWDEAMLHVKYQIAAVHSSWDIVWTKKLHWMSWTKVKCQICKITSLCTATCNGDITHQIWTLYHKQLSSNGMDEICRKGKVQGHHANVKGQMLKICILLYLWVHVKFINTNTYQVQQNLQMTLTYILNFKVKC